MRWIFPSQDKNKQGSLLQRLLGIRGLDITKDKLSSANTADLLPAKDLFDTASAAKKIIKAIKEKKKIFVHGDYDVDGVCATAVMWEFLYRYAGADVLPYIPSRFDEGYGLSESSITAMQSDGVEMIITVDCGIRDAELVKKYSDSGIDFVITDHHVPPTQLEFPKSTAVVHPMYPEHEYPMVEMCGAAVAWKLCCVINEKLGLNADMEDLLDLVGLATVCDVMPLRGDNRIFVKRGIEKMREGKRVGLVELAKVAGFEISAVESYQLGYVLGPRLNAAGRMESALTALKLLTTKQVSQARELAVQLDTLNKQRQEVTQTMLEQAEAQIDLAHNLLFIYHPEWPEGVIGLVAGKLAEKYYRPVMVGSVLGEEVKFSARSIEGFHISEKLASLDDLLVKYGGHALAAGATVQRDKLEDFRDKLLALAGDIAVDSLEPTLRVDLWLSDDDLEIPFVEEVSILEPFGMGNPRPVFAISGLQLVRQDKFGKLQNHQKFLVRTAAGQLLELIDFGGSISWPAGSNVNAAGSLDIHEWNGRKTLRFLLRDVKGGEAIQ